MALQPMATDNTVDANQNVPDDPITTFKVGDATYDVPNSKVEEFKKRYKIGDTPAKSAKSAEPTTKFTVNGTDYHVPESKIPEFKSRYKINDEAENDSKISITDTIKGVAQLGAKAVSGAAASVAGSAVRTLDRAYNGSWEPTKQGKENAEKIEKLLSYTADTPEAHKIVKELFQEPEGSLADQQNKMMKKLPQRVKDDLSKAFQEPEGSLADQQNKMMREELPAIADVANVAMGLTGAEQAVKAVEPLATAAGRTAAKVASATAKGIKSAAEGLEDAAGAANDPLKRNARDLNNAKQTVTKDAPKLYEKNADKAGIKIDKKDLRKKDPQETIDVKKQKIGRWMNDNEIVDTSKKGTDQTIDMLSKTNDRLKVHGKSLEDNLRKLDAQNVTHKSKTEVLEQLNKDLEVDAPNSHFTPAQKRAVRQVKTWIENHGNVGKGEDRQIMDNLKPTDIQSIIEDLNKQTQPFAGDTTDAKGAKEIYKNAYNSLREQLRDAASKADYHVTLEQLEQTNKGGSAHITVEDLKQQYLKALDDYHNGKIVQDSLVKKAQRALNTATGKQKSMLEDLVGHSAIIIGSSGEHTGGLGALVKVPAKKLVDAKNNFDYKRLKTRVNKALDITKEDEEKLNNDRMREALISTTRELRGQAPPGYKPPDDEPPKPKGPSKPKKPTGPSMESMAKKASEDKINEWKRSKKDLEDNRARRAAKILKDFDDETNRLMNKNKTPSIPKVKTNGLTDRMNKDIDKAIQEHLKRNPNRTVEQLKKDTAKIAAKIKDNYKRKSKLKVQGNVLTAERFNKDMEAANKRNAPANRLHHDAEQEARKTRILQIAKWVDEKGNTPMTDKFRGEVEEATNKAYEEFKKKHKKDAKYKPPKE